MTGHASLRRLVVFLPRRGRQQQPDRRLAQAVDALNKQLSEVAGSDLDAKSKIARAKLLQSQIQAVQNQIEALQRASQMAQQAAQRDKAMATAQGPAAPGEGRSTRSSRGLVDLTA